MTRSLLMLLLVTLVGSSTALAQVHETVLYSFGSSPNDGMTPNGVLAFDASGNVYGTTQRGGANGAGTVFELTPTAAGMWSESVVYHFCSQPNCVDGALPFAGLVLDEFGNLYGTTISGGTYSGGTCGGNGCGTVFELSPPTIPGGNWSESVLWNFKGDLQGDAALPVSRLAWDPQGNLFGTTESGGDNSHGTVFELSPASGGGWNESLLYTFCMGGPPCPDGVEPMAGVSIDMLGNIFGTTYAGGNDLKWGTVYRLSPQGDGIWSESTLHHFTAQDGGQSLARVGLDPEGNLYGTVSTGEQGGLAECGAVWKMSAQGSHFQESAFVSSGTNGCTPMAGVFVDAKANTVVGTTSAGGAFNAGTIFKITGTRQKMLYNFCQQSGCADGSTPSGSFTAHGNALYSTTAKGGAFNQGVVFAITP